MVQGLRKSCSLAHNHPTPVLWACCPILAVKSRQTDTHTNTYRHIYTIKKERNIIFKKNFRE